MHALFDTVAKAGNRGIIDARTINDLAKKYAASSGDTIRNSKLN